VSKEGSERGKKSKNSMTASNRLEGRSKESKKYSASRKATKKSPIRTGFLSETYDIGKESQVRTDLEKGYVTRRGKSQGGS